MTWKLFRTFRQYKWLKAPTMISNQGYCIAINIVACVSSVVEITKLYLFLYVPVFWLSIIFIHSNFPPLNILSRWTLKSYFHGECQQAHSKNSADATLNVAAASRGGPGGQRSAAQGCCVCRVGWINFRGFGIDFDKNWLTWEMKKGD